MNALASIDLHDLVTVTGGEGDNVFGPGAGPNRSEITGEIRGKTPLVEFGGNGAYRRAETNYATCIANQPAGTSGEQMARNCNPLAGIPNQDR